MKFLVILLILLVVVAVVLVVRSRNKRKARVVKSVERGNPISYTGTVYEHREPIGRTTKPVASKPAQTYTPKPKAAKKDRSEDEDYAAGGYVADIPSASYYETSNYSEPSRSTSYDYSPAPSSDYSAPSSSGSSYSSDSGSSSSSSSSSNSSSSDSGSGGGGGSSD